MNETSQREAELRTLVLILLLPAVSLAASLTIPQTSYKRCKEKREPGSCYELAELYQKSSVDKNKALGNEYVLYGCSLELKRTCSLEEANVRREAYLSQKESFDEEKQKALRAIPQPKTQDELDCEKGIAKACDAAGTHFQFLATPATDAAKAKVYYEKGCKLGYKGSCDTLELMRKGIIKVFDVDM